MIIKSVALGGEDGQEVHLPDEIFGLEPRADILHRVVRWQRAKSQQGTHKVKTRSETSYSRRKMIRQKGAGSSRRGDRNSPILRGGGVYKGPAPRSHAHDLPKKIRKLGLKHALSVKATDGKISVLVAAELESGRTSELKALIGSLGWKKTLVIDGPNIEAGFVRAAANIPGLDVLPSQGANVYDILRHDQLVLTEAGLKGLQERL